jgi:hypothetical protein
MWISKQTFVPGVLEVAWLISLEALLEKVENARGFEGPPVRSASCDLEDLDP